MFLSRQTERSYDIIVAGAGPAGSMAAWQAAQQKVSVLLLEKDREVGTPVRCAEGVARRDLERLVGHAPLPGWVAAEISKFRLFAPDGTPVYVSIDDVGYVLNRRLFDYDLAVKAVSAGAGLLTQAEVVGVLKSGEKIIGAEVRLEGEILSIPCQVLIAADGVESRVARWAGIDSTIPLKEMETCAQNTLAGISIEPDTCDFYFSQDFAPGGYAWVFPKGPHIANVGLGISGIHSRHKSPEDYLSVFLDRYFPRGSVVSRTVGGVPVNKTLKKLVTDGFMVAGDAAHQANPISGGGIISAMIAGQLAGEVAARAVHHKKTDQRQLSAYAREWQKRVGKSHQRYYRLKEALMKFDDRNLNQIAAEYLKLEKGKQNLLNLFKVAFKSNPAFLMDVIKLFSPF